MISPVSPETVFHTVDITFLDSYGRIVLSHNIMYEFIFIHTVSTPLAGPLETLWLQRKQML